MCQNKQTNIHTRRTILCEGRLVLFFQFNLKVSPCNVYPTLTLQHAIDQMWENIVIVKISIRYLIAKYILLCKALMM